MGEFPPLLGMCVMETRITQSLKFPDFQPPLEVESIEELVTVEVEVVACEALVQVEANAPRCPIG